MDDAEQQTEQKGHQGQATKDMESVTGYFDELKDTKQDQNKLHKVGSTSVCVW
jgi:hypothetical protein